MADGRHFEKTVKSPYLCYCLTDFDEIWYSDALSWTCPDMKAYGGMHSHVGMHSQQRPHTRVVVVGAEPAQHVYRLTWGGDL